MSGKGMTEARRHRAEQVVALREQGLTFDEIAAQVGVSATRCRDDYTAAMIEARPDTAQRVWAALTADYELLRSKAMAAVLEMEPVDLAAIQRAAGVLERIARFHGLLDPRGVAVQVDSVEVTMAAIQDQFRTITEADAAEFMERGGGAMGG